MNVLFIKYGNQIFQREQVVSAEYRRFDEEDAKVIQANSILYISTTDGKELRFKDIAADVLWKVMSDWTVDLG